MDVTQHAVGILDKSKARSGSGVLVACLLAALPCVSACTSDVNGALVIVQNQIPESKMGSCLIPSKRSDTRLISGTYDVDLDQAYPFFLYPLLKSNLPPLSDDKGVEPNRMEYTGVEVKIEPPPGVTFPSTPECPTEFAFKERVSMDPGAEIGSMVQAFLPCHSTALKAMFKAGTLPTDLSTFVRFRLVVRAKAKLGADTITSDPFEYPVRVCMGCLQVGFQGEFSRFDYPKVAPCQNIASNPYSGNACNPSQDTQVLCCDKGGGALDCPARAVEPLAAP